jgi:hypothetical protein
MEVASRLEGHACAVACVAACDPAAQLASGGEVRPALCWWCSTATHEPRHHRDASHSHAMVLITVRASATMQPHATPCNPTDASQDGRLVVHDLETGAAAFTTQLGSSDSARGGSGEEDAVAAVTFSPGEGAPLVYAAFGRSAVCIDQRAGSPVVATYPQCADDVGCVAVHAKGGFLALGDDTGCVQASTGAPCTGSCLEAAWKLPGSCLEAAWKLPGSCLEAAWKLPGSCLEVAWKLPGSCEAAWKLHGICLESAWKLPGSCLEAVLHLHCMQYPPNHLPCHVNGA